MADQDMTSLPQRSQAVSWTRWLTGGLLLAVVALVSRRWPGMEWAITVGMLGLAGIGVALWGIKELLEEVRDTLEAMAPPEVSPDPATRAKADDDRRRSS